jgi:predicted nucleotidyltransferase
MGQIDNLFVAKNILAVWAAERTISAAGAIFGSYAKSRTRPDSDIDIAIIVDLTGFHDRLADTSSASRSG